MKPKPSNFCWSRRTRLGSVAARIRKPTKAIGMLMKNTQRQLSWSVSTPPRIGPMIGPQHGAHAPERHGAGVVLRRIDVEQDSLAQRNEHRRRGALEDAIANQLDDAAGDAAQHG